MTAAVFVSLGLMWSLFSGQTGAGEAVALDRISGCGIPRKTIAVKRNEGGLIELAVARAPPPRDDQQPTAPDIDCAVTAAIESELSIEFADNYVNEHFQHAYEVAHRARTKRVATAWLVARGMFANLPIFDADTDSLAGYGRKIETFCAIPPGTIVHQYDVMVLAFKRRSAESGVTDTQMECLSQSFGASNLNSDYNDFFFGIVVDQYGVLAEGKR
ncbi:hypothetical protein [Sphingomonas sp. M1-B02]|uniref:hypothetical protein n=1 Tax=Sphingomonas sp. M1-B02 TaxID=3114300 RepID=UPI00223FD7D7|nr:hypothetical protein [Sphingomonas sp. S6-11]UZK67833.1 hypothetical protein OKW87_08440 [Sphingomonas sp. S6-11]